MPQVYFHCSNLKEALIDRYGAVVDDLAEARDHAARVVRSLTKARSLEDWRGWVMHVNDDLGDELFLVPFAFMLWKPQRSRDARGSATHSGAKVQCSSVSSPPTCFWV
jgi:hypothetical protein